MQDFPDLRVYCHPSAVRTKLRCYPRSDRNRWLWLACWIFGGSSQPFSFRSAWAPPRSAAGRSTCLCATWTSSRWVPGWRLWVWTDTCPAGCLPCCQSWRGQPPLLPRLSAPGPLLLVTTAATTACPDPPFPFAAQMQKLYPHSLTLPMYLQICSLLFTQMHRSPFHFLFKQIPSVLVLPDDFGYHLASFRQDFR